MDDVVESVILSVNREVGNLYEVFNVCNKRPVHVQDIVTYIEDHMPFAVDHEYAEGTPGDQKGIYGEYTKINKMLGWKGTIPFEEGMQKMIDWALNK